MVGNLKVLIVGVLVALAIIAGGIFFFSKQSSDNKAKVNQDLLARSDSQKVKAPSEKVVLVEFGDFQCPACGAYHSVVQKLLTDNKDNLTFVYRNFPLNIHKNANLAAYAAEAAGLQGKYWQMHDMIFETQDKWSTSTDVESIFVGYAKTLGLDTDKFRTDMNSEVVKKKVEKDAADGLALGVDSTPTFYLNGEKINTPANYEDFNTLIKAAILKQKTEVSSEEKYHAHFDLKVYINGRALDLSLPKYQSTEEKELDEGIHSHDGNGKVVHLHKKGVPLSQYFESIKVGFPSDGKPLRVFVNGKENNEALSYIAKDLDRILVVYGVYSDSQIKNLVNSVSDLACIYSETCPERGTPPEENCVGGLGSDCSD
ncbi:MAG: thioredoxin domain-containing protein [Patescibacteria group bacterium]